MIRVIPDRPRRVLLVGHDADLRIGLALILSSTAYQVEHASNGTAAMLMHQRQFFDVIVSEVIMPDFDGLELMLTLTRVAPRPKFVFVSKKSRIPEEVLQRIITRLGVRHILPMPFPPEQLLAAVEEVLAEA